jgi:hypothetical protein
MVDFELSFQFPIKRDGASPVVAAVEVPASVAEAVASGVADADSAAIGDSLTAGAGAASSVFFLEFEITIPPSSTTPTRTRRSTLLDEPCFGAADGLVIDFAGAGRADASGVVETLTRDPPVVGTGGITTFDDDDFFAGDFLTAFLVVFFAAVFLTAFLAVVFFAAVFLTARFAVVFFFAAVFLAGDFFAVFFAVDFFGAAFLAALFFFTATVYLLELCNGGIWEKFNLGF